MGVSNNAQQFTAKLTQAEKAFGEMGTRKSLLPTSAAVKRVMLTSAAGAGLRPGSKIAGRPWRGVYVRNQGNNDLAVGYANPAHLVNNNTKAHVIGARGLGTKAAIRKRTVAAAVGLLLGGSGVASFKGRENGARALHFGSRFAAYVHHPATRGKRFFERALPVAQSEGGKEMGKTFSRTLARVFE